MAFYQDDGTVATKAIQIAAQQAGKPYVWGAAGPDAFDCSGLVHFAYATAGLPGAGKPTTHAWVTAGIAFMGEGIPYGQEQPGDLVMPTAGHVGIVIGNGQMWNAPETGIPVRVNSYGKPFAIRRLSTPSNNSATAGNATTTAVTTSSNPLTQITDTLSAFGTAFTWISTGHNWIRIFEVVGGTVALYLATKAI